MEFAGKKYRIKSNFRFTAFVALVILTLVIFFNLFLGLGDVSGLEQTKFIEVTVNYGDTLWQIADTYMPNGVDLRDCVDIICDVNGVNASTLTPGQVILVPIN